ncbi:MULTISPECIES: gluconokinase [Streptomycetaceae]|uniref:Gluconokinase n=1 Tax=Streptantibioticus cattleyicolor (strain ATCC 35852 / DSM 46488 / JCM 4925 / NBRC 14057 / NRRL 8057) TaxID=1003195 RepID=F8JW84_STREN|nr:MULTISPECIES: gluconokinase [Streptomycetaceae]AEW93262.1 gluconokinase [Streptantibioticus cattleyicolor NRRL 8057 = DSM 46488]MYS57983.1 AAA family ATPase [Streptomyces sp. SID5468]CCB73622.1 putative gluconokinase [Streptantibioticus cattleyicolor NRRL 8057 = DSM 46488]
MTAEDPQPESGSPAASGPRPRSTAPVVVVMGVSGSGKSTVGGLLAERLGVPYAEADDFHPPANIAKMSAGHPLDDADRAPWLNSIAEWIARHNGDGGVVTCSALKRRYRDRLREAAPGLFFLHLDGSAELIAARLQARMEHFMPPELLRSQLDALEPLEPDEAGAVIPIDGGPRETTDRALAALPR